MSTCSRDMFNALEEGRAPQETFYDGYVVNAIMDASYRSAKSDAWEPVELFEWRGGATARIAASPEAYGRTRSRCSAPGSSGTSTR